METADILLSPVSRAVFFGYGICDSRSGGDAGDFNGPYGRQLDIASRAEPPDRPCLADGDVLFR